MKCRHTFNTSIFSFVLLAGAVGQTSAATILGGQAKMSIDISALSSPPGALSFDYYFGLPGNQAATLTRSQMVNGPFDRLPGTPTSANDLDFQVNPAVVTDPTGRHRQPTDLTYDPSNVLASWSPSSVGPMNVSGGEQIGLDGVLRMTVSDAIGGGVFLFGDFGLRYAPELAVGANSGLVLTNNFDSQNSPLFYIGNASIVANEDSLTITGDLLLSDLYATFFGGRAGSDVGDFRLAAYTSAAVPEPGSLALISLGMVCLVPLRSRLRRKPDVHRGA